MKKIYLSLLILCICAPVYAYKSEIIPLRTNLNIQKDNNTDEYKYIKEYKQPIAPVEEKESININAMQLNAIPSFINDKKVRYDHNGMPKFTPLTTNEIIFEY
ncbi:hypothetical protein IJ182_05555 [bacterium]|nr:hypothetical protein [bacterium]